MRTKLKLDEENSVFDRKYQEREEPRRINLNELLKRSKDEKEKVTKTNILVFSVVVFSAALVVIAISYL